MSLLSNIAEAFLGRPEDFQTREIEIAASFDEQLAAIRRRRELTMVPWRLATVEEALGVPAILGAVSLISDTVGSLSMEAYRAGVLLTDPAQVPRLIVRPNPRTTPRVFFRDTAFYLATRGEAWWKIAARDTDNSPLSLVCIPPWELDVQRNDADRLSPFIYWLGRKQNNDDWRQITYLPDRSGLRGVGPLQLAGAAVSVTVEANTWAANFFSGSLPSLIFSTDQDLDPDDMQTLQDQWLEKPNNIPRFMEKGLEPQDPPYDATKAQLTESRQHQVGETARMFSMPGALIEYQMSGSSLVYQNQQDIWSDFQRRCLSPHYLEPVEQEISDLLTRSTVARFNLNQLLRADIKTRFDVYESGVTKSGVLSVQEARRMEGLDPGNVDFAPVQPAPPQADPGPIPYQIRSAQGEWRCSNCNRKIAESQGMGTTIRCRCGTVNVGESLQMREQDQMSVVLAALASREQPQITVPTHVHMDKVQLESPDLSKVHLAILEQIEEQKRTGDLIQEVLARPQEPPQITYVPPDQVFNIPKPDPVVIQFPKPTRKVIERDENGHIIGLREEPA